MTDLKSLRIASAVFAFITICGWFWSAGSNPSILWHGWAFITTVVLITASLSPSRLYKTKTKYVIASIYLTGILVTLPVIYEDYTLINGADYPAMIIRSVEIYVLGTLARVALSNKK